MFFLPIQLKAFQSLDFKYGITIFINKLCTIINKISN